MDLDLETESKRESVDAWLGWDGLGVADCRRVATVDTVCSPGFYLSKNDSQDFHWPALPLVSWSTLSEGQENEAFVTVERSVFESQLMAV